MPGFLGRPGSTGRRCTGSIDASVAAVLPLFAAVVIATVASVAIAAWVIVRLPADCLRRDRDADADPRSRVARIARNVVGALLVALGVMLALPGVPGQGLLVVLAGLLLVDVPGKRALLAKLLARPSLRRAVDRLRRRCARPPLELD